RRALLGDPATGGEPDPLLTAHLLGAALRPERGRQLYIARRGGRSRRRAGSAVPEPAGRGPGRARGRGARGGRGRRAKHRGGNLAVSRERRDHTRPAVRDGG